MASVWIKEIDTALQALINNTAKAPDANGTLQKVTTFVEYPDGDFVSESYPCATINQYGMSFARERAYWEDFKVGRNDTTKVAIMAKPSKEYDLFFQIDFWSLYKEDIVSMLATWLGAIPAFSSLSLKDSGGTTVTTDMIMNRNPVTRVEASGEEKIYRAILDYKIRAYLDEQSTVEVPYAEGVDMTVEPMP